MAFTSAVTDVRVQGNRKIAYGTFTNAGTDSGGEIDTGLSYVDVFLYSVSSHLGAESMKVTKNSSSAGKVTVVSSDGADGDWVAFGL